MPLSKPKKVDYFKKMTGFLNTYSKVFVVLVDNVGSQQMNATRRQMRGVAEILMGKNTLMRKVLKDFLEKNPGHFHASLDVKMTGNVGFVFTNAELPKVRDMILANRVPAPARIGAIAPVDVSVPAGPTGCDPGQTSFFQVLQIPTKIVKGQIEITNVVNLIKKGDKVGSSEAALLSKLNIKPFSYGLSIDCIFDQGSMFSVDVLDITDDEIISKFVQALTKVASLSLEIGYPTQASLPHVIGQAFKTIVAVAVGLDNYTFTEAEPFKAYLKDPSAFASSAPVAEPAAGGGSSAPVAAAAAPEKPKEEEVDALDGGMDMFGGGSAGAGGDY
jgi:large subunit ribosomal protein LP0